MPPGRRTISRACWPSLAGFPRSSPVATGPRAGHGDRRRRARCQHQPHADPPLSRFQRSLDHRVATQHRPFETLLHQAGVLGPSRSQLLEAVPVILAA